MGWRTPQRVELTLVISALHVSDQNQAARSKSSTQSRLISASRDLHMQVTSFSHPCQSVEFSLSGFASHCWPDVVQRVYSSEVPGRLIFPAR